MLGDRVRLRLLSLIASHDGGEACVCDLTDAFDVTGPTISHHLKVVRTRPNDIGNGLLVLRGFEREGEATVQEWRCQVIADS